MDKKTITTIFIVPTLKIGKEKLVENGFINGYVKDISQETVYDDCVYLLFKPKNLEKFRDFLEEEYERTKLIIEDYDCGEGYIVVIYSLDPNFKRDYTLVKTGKYSKTSKDFQALFPKIVKILIDGAMRDEISLAYRVFNKTKDLRQFWEEKFDTDFDDSMEVWTTFIEEEESLDLKKLTNVQ